MEGGNLRSTYELCSVMLQRILFDDYRVVSVKLANHRCPRGVANRDNFSQSSFSVLLSRHWY